MHTQAVRKQGLLLRISCTYGERCRKHLTNHGSNCRSHYSPAKPIDEDWVKDNICNCTGDCCSHCKFRASVTAHYRIHSLTEHIERYAQRNVKEVLLCKRVSFLVYRSAEQAENWFAEEQVNSRQHKAAHYAENNGIANRLVVRIFIFFSSRCNTYKSTATVSDEHGDTKGNHRQRENGGICGVAARAKIV